MAKKNYGAPVIQTVCLSVDVVTASGGGNVLQTDPTTDDVFGGYKS